MMHHPSRFLLLLSLLTLCAGCGLSGIKGSGISKTSEIELKAFRSIEQGSIAEVKLFKGEKQSVKLTFDDNLFELMEFKVVEGQLTIKNTGSFSSIIGPRVEITMPSIERVELSGVGAMKLSGVEEEKLDLVVSGVGSITADGKVQSLNVVVSGVGGAELKGLEADAVVVNVSGVGSAEVTAKTSIDANTSGVGGITVHGGPAEVKKSSSGLGTVKVK